MNCGVLNNQCCISCLQDKDVVKATDTPLQGFSPKLNFVIKVERKIKFLLLKRIMHKSHSCLDLTVTLI